MPSLKFDVRVSAFLAISLLAIPGVSRADSMVVMPANGCTVDPRSASTTQYNHGGITFAGTATGQIILYCPIPRFT
jgi:hypothetical protein